MNTPPIFRSPLVTAAARTIIGIANAVTRDEVEERFSELLRTAGESDEHLDAAYLATQMCRDLRIPEWRWYGSTE